MTVEKIFCGKVPVAVYYPAGYEPGKQYPVWLFFHGKGELSQQTATLSELQTKVVSNGNHANLLAKADKEGWIVVAPLLVQSLNNWIPGWTNDYLKPVYDYIVNAAFTDRSHIVVTGLSLGGGGVWVAITGPFGQFISAAIPICGTPQYDQDYALVKLNQTPVWAFHAKDDTQVNVAATINTIEKINRLNPDPKPKMTLYDTGGHGIWGRVYQDEEMYAWAMTADKVAEAPPPTDEILSVHKITVYKSGKVEIVKQ